MPNQKTDEIKWNYDPKLGEFLSRKGVEELLNKARRDFLDEINGNDAYMYLGKELHLFCREIVEKVKITKNGKIYEIDLQALTPNN